jgi:uncharacterized membrane protein YdbT with pleckstrin-like domain
MIDRNQIISRGGNKMARDKSLWRARKNNFLGLPWTFTVYELTNDRLFVESGFLNKKEDEVRLYRILDLELNRSLGQRIFGMGTIKVSSSDRSLKNFELVNIKNPKAIKEMLSQLVEEQRDAKRVVNREMMGIDTDFEDDDEF